MENIYGRPLTRRSSCTSAPVAKGMTSAHSSSRQSRLATAAILALSAGIRAFTLEYAVSGSPTSHRRVPRRSARCEYSGQNIFHQNVVAAAVIAALAGMLAGLALDIGLIERFRGRSAISVFIATLGAALIVENVLVVNPAPLMSPTRSRRATCTTSGRSCGRRGAYRGDRLGAGGGSGCCTCCSSTRGSARRSGRSRKIERSRRLVALRRGGSCMRTWALAGAALRLPRASCSRRRSVTLGPWLSFTFLLLTITATVAGGIGRPYATLGGALIVGLVLQISGTYRARRTKMFRPSILLVYLMVFQSG